MNDPIQSKWKSLSEEEKSMLHGIEVGEYTNTHDWLTPMLWLLKRVKALEKTK